MGKEIDNKCLKVGIYLRLSDEDRDKTNKLDISESIKNQRYLLIEEIKKRDNFRLVDEYVDENLSGAGTYRPEFERLIKDCESGKLDVVLCKSQSRFSRDMEIIEKYLHNKFIEWNVRFISLSDYADTETPGNKKARQINGLVNEWYLEDVSNNIRSAFRAKMLNGEYISPFVAYGYKLDDSDNNKLVVDERASYVVKEIFILYLNGFGYGKIAKELNVRKIPSPSYYKYLNGIKLNVISNKRREQIKWSANAVKRILTNEIYLGHLIQGKRTTVSYKNHKIKQKPKGEWIKRLNTHQAIIENDLFFKVQKMMLNRTRVSKKNGNIHVLAGKVYCLDCGGMFRKKNSSKHSYLVCSNSELGNCNNKKSIRYDILEQIILQEINSLVEEFKDKKLINDLICKNSIYKKEVKYLEMQKIDVMKKIKKIDFYIKNLYEDKVNKVIEVDDFNSLINEYKINKNNYQIQLEEIIKKIKEEELQKNNIVTNSFLKSFDELNRVIIDEFVDRIVIGTLVSDDREITIDWNIKKNI